MGYTDEEIRTHDYRVYVDCEGDPDHCVLCCRKKSDALCAVIRGMLDAWHDYAPSSAQVCLRTEAVKNDPYRACTASNRCELCAAKAALNP